MPQTFQNLIVFVLNYLDNSFITRDMASNASNIFSLAQQNVLPSVLLDKMHQNTNFVKDLLYSHNIKRP